MNRKKISVPTALMLMLLVAVTCVIITNFAAAERYDSELSYLQKMENKYTQLKEITDIIEKNFVGEYDEEEAIDMMLAGYVDGLGDQWSGFYTAEQTERINEYNANSYVGIGITIKTNENGEYEVTAVNKKGPALKAGVAVRDIIIKVNGKPASEYETQDDLVAEVRGEEGTKVYLTFARDGDSYECEITRKKIYNESVITKIVGDNIGYVSIDNFESNVDKEFIEKVGELIGQGVKGLIFDVRFNGGGYVTVMKNMLDILLPEGTVISMVNKAGKTTSYKSDADCIKLPMAVLTNEYSISAAEFFAAALQEYGVATVVGDKTGGKGYAQTLFELKDGSSLNLSVYKYYTPKGISLVGKGVTPDIEISLSEEDFINFYSLTVEQDTQLQAAIGAVSKMIG